MHSVHFHLLCNAYLIILFIGILIVLLKLHDIKLLLMTFFETISLLSNYINKLEAELHKDEEMIERRVNNVSESILNILSHLSDVELKRKEEENDKENKK